MTTIAWDPQQYGKFSDYRLRPGLELIARIPDQNYKLIYDLGCGTGVLTNLLKQRWPKAKIIGVDNSPAMLELAKKNFHKIEWLEADIQDWQPEEPADLIFSNAALHWVSHHEKLFPRLISYLTPGGILAVQMPNNFAELSHANLATAAGAGPWRDVLWPLLPDKPVGTLDDYYAWICSLCAELDLWKTTYLHILQGENPVVEWMKGSFLKAFLDALTDEWTQQFLTIYTNLIKIAYPMQSDGTTLFPFRRLFVVAKKNTHDR